MFPATYNRNEGGFDGCSPVPITGTRVHADVPGTKNRNEGTFAKTALLLNRPFVSSRMSRHAISQKAFQPEFGAYRGLVRLLKSPLNPQNCRNKQTILEKDTSIFCAKVWFKPPFCSSREVKGKEDFIIRNETRRKSASPKPHPSKLHPCNVAQAKTEVALQFSESCAAEVALQHSLFCSAEMSFAQKLRCC